MEYIAFPLRLEPSGQLAREAGGASESLLHLLRIMLRTPARGWAGSANFGVRDWLAKVPADVNARFEVVKRMNESLRELGIDWVSVNMVELDLTSGGGEPTYLLTLIWKEQGSNVQKLICSLRRNGRE